MIIGDLNVVNAIVNLEVQVIIQGKIIEMLAKSSSTTISQPDVDRFRNQAQTEVSNKYPALGIKWG